MKKQIRQPKQTRSVEKKNKIIEAGYALFAEVGYYGTNTAEIAKKAGVSTGIVYGYFKDKKDILVCALNIYIKDIFAPVEKFLSELKKPLNYGELASEVIDLTIKIHSKNSKMHEALHSFAANDKDVNAEFIAFEDRLTSVAAERLTELGANTLNFKEKIHLCLNLVQSFAHESVYDKHDYIDYSAMRKMVEKTIVNLFD